jgi:CRP-like cAMP-binding protein
MDAPSRTLPESLARFAEEVTVRAGRAFYLQDESAEAAYWLVSGRVRPVKFALDGKPFDLPEIQGPRWLALAELVAGGPCLFDAVALTECRALSIGRRGLALALKDGEVADFIMRSLSLEVQALHRVIGSGDARGKIVSFLVSRRASLAGIERSSLSLTQVSLAEAVGLTRETVNRHLRELELSGLVTLARGEIGIPDWDALSSAGGRR